MECGSGYDPDRRRLGARLTTASLLPSGAHATMPLASPPRWHSRRRQRLMRGMACHMTNARRCGKGRWSWPKFAIESLVGEMAASPTALGSVPSDAPGLPLAPQPPAGPAVNRGPAKHDSFPSRDEDRPATVSTGARNVPRRNDHPNRRSIKPRRRIAVREEGHLPSIWRSLRLLVEPPPGRQRARIGAVAKPCSTDLRSLVP